MLVVFVLTWHNYIMLAFVLVSLVKTRLKSFVSSRIRMLNHAVRSVFDPLLGNLKERTPIYSITKCRDQSGFDVVQFV